MVRSPLTAAALLLAVLAAAAVALDRDERWRRLREIAGSRSVPGEAIGSTRFGRALAELELLHALPRGRRPDAPAARLGPIPARRGSIPDQLSVRPPGGHHLLAAYRLDGVERAAQVPVVSLLMPREELAAMQRTPLLRGRESERPAFVGLFEGGKLLLGTGCGARIHGGASRDSRRSFNYRLTARRAYGAPTFAPAPFPESRGTAAHELVLRLGHGSDHFDRIWHFTSPLALDVVRRVGVPAPRSRPVLFVLNGHDQGVYELSDYLGPGFLEDRFGLTDYVLVRTKRNRNEGDRSMVKEGPEEPYEEFLHRVQALRNAPRERAGEWVDLDNLYRWILAVTFLDTRDAFQGALVRDLAEPSARWFWIAWDLDISFGLPHLPAQDGWRTNSLELMLTRKRMDPRRWLFIWLMASPEERERFAALAVETLNHRLDGEFLAGRIAFYRDQAELFGLEDRRFLDEMEEFLINRPRGYRRHLEETLELGPARTVRVVGPPGARLEIDGHPVAAPWRGEYFDGMSVRLAAPAGATALIDGEERILGPEPLEVRLAGDLEIAL